MRRYLTPPYPLNMLPNREGFRFTGVLKDGSTRPCVVTTRLILDRFGQPVPGEVCHTVAGYGELAGWMYESDAPKFS